MKPLKIIHTSDWHLGQTFFEYDRTYEHQQFLDWLLTTLKSRDIDVLLIAGDIFDVSNPSASAMRLFYNFLRKASQIKESLQIIVIAGNHDSPARLEMPRPLLEAFNIHVVGNIERKDDQSIDFSKILIPILDEKGGRSAWCIAMPYIRACDLLPGAYNGCNLAENIENIYQQAFEEVAKMKSDNEPVIAMGHLHAMNAELSSNDASERPLMGGLEFIPISIFNEKISYVALGHIHKAQKLGGKEYIRYSGSPLPMSFSELKYRHQLVYFELKELEKPIPEIIEIPVSVSLIKIPQHHSSLLEAVTELEKLPLKFEDSYKLPYLQVQLLLDGPEPALRARIEAALENKHARLAKIDVRYNQQIESDNEVVTFEKLQELLPFTVFQKIYKKNYKQDVPDELSHVFHQIVDEIKREI